MLILLLLGLGMVAVGLWSSRGVRDFDDFALSRGHFGSGALAMTVVATGVGGGVVVGMAEKGYAMGIGCAIGLLGFALQLFLIGRLAPKIVRLGAPLSVGEMIGQYYGKAARIATGLLWLAFCAGIIAAQLAALGMLLSSYFPLSPAYCAAIGAILLLAYCCAGGIRAVVLTDLLQLTLMLITLPLVAAFALYKLGGIQTLLVRLPTDHLSPIGHLSPFQLAALFGGFLLGDLFIPPMMQRVVMASQDRIARRSFSAAALLTTPFCLLGTLMGLTAFVFNSDLPSSVALPYLFQEVLPGWVGLLAAVGLMAAILSSADSYLQAAAVAVVHDLVTPLRRTPFESSSALQLARLSTLAIGGVSLIIAARGSAVIDLLLHAYSFWGPMMVVPIFSLILGWKLPRQAFFFSVGIGAITVLSWQWFDLEKTVGINALIPGIFVNLIATSCVRFFVSPAKSRHYTLGLVGSESLRRSEP